jgi:hypothetical protein
MQGTTRSRVYQPALVVLHGLVVLSVLGLALLGQMPGEAAGWLVQPAVPGGGVRLRPPPRVRFRRPGWSSTSGCAGAVPGRDLAAGIAAQSAAMGVMGGERPVGLVLAAPGAVGVVAMAGHGDRVAELAPAGSLGVGGAGTVAGPEAA